MNIGDLIISLFMTTLAFLFKSLAALPEQIPGSATVLTITLFALLLRLITLPIFFRQRRLIEREGELQERLMDLRTKYANDSQRFVQAQMELYRELGINPLSGCLLTLIQLPFVFGLYSALSVVLGSSPYQLWGMHGRILLTGLSDLIPFPVRFLQLDLAQPNLVVAVLVAVLAFVERRLAKKEQSDPLGMYIIPFALGIFLARSVASGVGIFLLVFYLANLALYLAAESAGLRRLFLGQGKTRRWELQRALKQKFIGVKRFDQLMTVLLQPPELQQEDIALAVKLLELGASNFRKGWPAAVAEKAGKVLGRLSEAGTTSYDLGALYYKFSEGCLKLGYTGQTADLAIQGYACPQSESASRTSNVLVLARAEMVDQRAKDIYKAFIAEHQPSSASVRKFAQIFQDKGIITPETDPGTVGQRIPLNACIAELLPIQLFPWAKSNLGLAYLILNEPKRARGYFQEILTVNPAEATAIQGLAIVEFRLQQYDQSLQVMETARQAGVSGAAIDAIEGFCRAAIWLADLQVTPLAWNQIEGWYAQLQGSFPLRRFLAAEAAYVQGRLAGIIGDWTNASQYLQAACNMDKKNLKFAYYYINLLQVSGEWELAAKALKEKKVGSAELFSQTLKQVRHDTSLDQLKPGLRELANDLEAKTPAARLASAQYALLAGHAADIPAWPIQLAFETPEQADEWAATWLAALIGRGAANEARQEMDGKRCLRLSRPEQLFLAGAVKWLSENRSGAENELKEALKLVPNYENALRLLAVILEDQGNAAQAYPLLERLQKVSPNDHHTVIRSALLNWQKGEERAAITQLQRLVSASKTRALAKFWIGRLLLIRATRSSDPQDLQQAGENLQEAVDGGISDARWYVWLCEAVKEYSSDTGWSRKKASSLIKRLPGSLSEIPIVEVAMAAALVAIETNEPAKMLAGCAILLNQLRDQQDRKVSTLVSLKNWTEALWRTATTVTSLNDRLALSQLAHQVGPTFPEYSRVARQVADAVVMSAINELTHSGENVDVVLAQVEAAIAMTPNALIPRLVRASLLINKGEMTAEDAVLYLKQECQPLIAQALEECARLTAGSPTSARPSGLAAFLTVNKASLPNLVSTLEALSIETIDRSDEAFLLEMARCMAAVDQHKYAVDLFSQAYEVGRSPAAAKEASDYLCHVVALEMTEGARTIVDLEGAQQLLYKARTYCLEGDQ